jgi:hypothetical protein
MLRPALLPGIPGRYAAKDSDKLDRLDIEYPRTYMRFVTRAQKHISAFISHSVEDNDEARFYEGVLRDAGFSAFQFGHALRPGDSIRGVVSDELRRCHFFLFIISDYSLVSEWVQRELGLALELRRQSRDYKPIIIPIYSKNASWRKSGKMPTAFPTRDFRTGEERSAFDPSAIRGLDRHANPHVDSGDVLISMMRPQLLVSRLDDFDDEATFEKTDTFRLYEDLFPPVERDSRDDIVRWVLRSDIGEQRDVRLPDGTAFSYKLDSRYFILCLAQQAIGLAFFTYDHDSKLIYGNYIAVQEFWRGGDIATAFLEESMKVQGEIFPDYEGVVFEVEKFDESRIERIISFLEEHDKVFETETDRDDVRRFLRVQWYQKLECVFFIDGNTKKPLVCRAPCIDPTETDWSSLEENYWIMWRPRGGLDMSIAKPLWMRTVNSIYIEILVKSLVECYPDTAMEYWRYSIAVVERILSECRSKDIRFGKYLDRRNSPLLPRWVKLGIELPI